MFSTHIPRTWPTITKFKLLINTNSELKIRNIATFFYQAFKKRNCVPILCIIPLCKYLPCFSCFVHAFHVFHMYCLCISCFHMYCLCISCFSYVLFMHFMFFICIVYGDEHVGLCVIACTVYTRIVETNK